MAGEVTVTSARPEDAEAARELTERLGWRYSGQMSKKRPNVRVVPSPDPNHAYDPDDIDWSYMESYIAELEAERIAELEAYLVATGLDDCALTPEDKAALAAEPPMAEFKVEDVFSISRAQGVPAKKDLIDGEIPYVTRATSNNGYAGTCGNVDKVTAGNCITIGGETAVSFYQPDDFVAGNNITCLRRDGLRQRHYHYLAATLNKQTSNYSYSNARSMQRIKVEAISLPVRPSPDPDHVYTTDDIDWGYMEAFIRAVEKQVMADVVAYKDEVIATTRRIVGGKEGD